MSSSFSLAKRSGLQREVLSLYAAIQRAIYAKPEVVCVKLAVLIPWLMR